MALTKKEAKIRSKAYCVLWLIVKGFIPNKYFWFRQLRSKKATTHLFFAYDKFKLCGQSFIFTEYGNETWSNGIWEFPKGLLKFS